MATRKADVTYQFRFKTTYLELGPFRALFLYNDFTIDSVNDADLLLQPVLHRHARGGQHLKRLGDWACVPAHEHRPALDRQTTRPTSAPAAVTNLSTAARPLPARATTLLRRPGLDLRPGRPAPFNEAHLVPLPTSGRAWTASAATTPTRSPFKSRSTS